MTGWSVAFYDLAGECCRFGRWWVQPPYLFWIGTRLFVLARVATERRVHIYEEVCG